MLCGKVRLVSLDIEGEVDKIFGEAFIVECYLIIGGVLVARRQLVSFESLPQCRGWPWGHY